MGKHLIVLVLILWPIYLSGQSTCPIPINQGDVTQKLDSLGNIPERGGYSINTANVPDLDGAVKRTKNIWDMAVYKDQVYIGYGSTADNAGPLDLYAYNPNLDGPDKWTLEESGFPSEAIDRFRIFNDELLIPISDRTHNSEDYVGLRYFHYDGITKGYVSDMTDANVYHIRDMYYYNDWYYMVGNSRGIFRRSDHGTPTQYNLADSVMLASDHCPYGEYIIRSPQGLFGYGEEPDTLNYPPDCNFNWTFGMLNINDTLVIPNINFTLDATKTSIPNTMFMVVEGDNISWSADMDSELTHQNFYPVVYTLPFQIAPLIHLRPFENVNLNGKCLYTLRTGSVFPRYYESMYQSSVGLFIKSNLRDKAKEVKFGDPSAVGEDLLTYEGKVYALTNSKNRIGYTVRVYSSSAPSHRKYQWTEVLRFQSTNIARSFEWHDGYFYFGLGANYDDPAKEVGEILRVKACSNLANAFESNTGSLDNKVTIYPNPTTDILRIGNLDIAKGNVTIIDINGMEVLNVRTSEVDLSSLKNGVYFLKIKKEEDDPILRKIVVER